MEKKEILKKCIQYLQEIQNIVCVESSENQKEFINKEEWGEGEWLNEPGIGEIIEFKYQDYDCILNRGWSSGSWCGYVKIKKSSKWALEENYEDIDVHGSVTYHSSQHPHKAEESNDSFWLGFDCAHSYDFSPRLEKILSLHPKDEVLEKMKEKFPDSIVWRKDYRTIEYATDQLKSMVNQINKEDKDDFKN